MMDTLKYLRLRPIGCNTKSPHSLITYYPSSLPNEKVLARLRCLRHYPGWLASTQQSQTQHTV
jgi:hypothetical protein